MDEDALFAPPDLLADATAIGGADVLADGNTRTVRVAAESSHAGLLLTFEGATRDWSGASCLVFTLRANGAHRMRLHFTHTDGAWTLFLVPRPGLTSRVVIPVSELRERAPNTGYPGYSRFGGGPQPVFLADVRSLAITFNQVSPEDKEATLSDFALLTGDVPASEVLEPAVVVDEWGQWTGERGVPRPEDEIRAAWAAEPGAFTGFPGHTERTGADAGHGRVAGGTGFFGVAEAEGRWFLVDPEGYAFFSIGCDCVAPSSSGPVGGREPLFADLSHATPGESQRGRWASPLWADFYRQNLQRRYVGREPWQQAWAGQTVARLRSWGFNTIANWSDPALTARGGMPYTTNVRSLGPLCERLPDVFAPDFAARVRALVAPEVAPFVHDPMLIGYFVGNEPAWTFGGHRHPFNDVFTAPEYPHTREKAVEWARRAYADDLPRLNAAWNASAASWEDLTRPGVIPDVRLGTDPLKRNAHEFMGSVLAEFYAVCCRELRAADPNHLLLGGRFYAPDLPDPYIRACSAFDVFSFNRYNWDANPTAIGRIATLTGRPVLIGEFHYGVEGRGLTASLVATRSQDDRGLAYRHFVENAAALPVVVGTHWFQWVDQPVTGRFDGECYNIGLVDVTDVPYHDFLAHVRETHARLYAVCRGETAPYSFPGERPSAW